MKAMLGDDNGSEVTLVPGSPLSLWAQVVARYGPLALIAGILVWYMATGIASDIKSVKDDLHTHMNEQHFYLRQLCINTARDERGMSQCEAPQK